MNLKVWLRAEWDRVASVVLIALGAVLVISGYLGAKGTPYAVEALAYIASGGIGGLFCLGLGVGLRLSGDLHDEWRKLDRVEAAIKGSPIPDAEDVMRLVRSSDAAGPAGGVLTTPPQVPLATGGAIVASGPMPRNLTVVLLVAGVVPLALVAAGWHTAKGTSDFDTSAGGAAIAGFGLVVLVGLQTARLLFMRSRLAGREGRLFGPYLAAATSAEPLHTPVSEAPHNGDRASERVLVIAGLRYFHRPGCAALEGQDSVAVSRREVGPDQVPCGLCGAQR